MSLIVDKQIKYCQKKINMIKMLRGHSDKFSG